MTAPPLKQPNRRAMYETRTEIDRYLSDSTILPMMYTDTYTLLMFIVYLSRVKALSGSGVPPDPMVAELYALQDLYWNYRFDFENLYTRTGTFIYALDSVMVAFWVHFKIDEEDVQRGILEEILKYMYDDDEVEELISEAQLNLEGYLIGVKEMIEEFEKLE